MTHISTTLVGSMPRGEELTPLLIARDNGQPYDAAEFDRLVPAATDDADAKQVECGVDIVSDGEMGKVGYSTYMTERLSGFGGHVDREPAADLAAHPGLAKKLSAIMGNQEFIGASCVGKVELVDDEPMWEDITRFKAALAKAGRTPTDGFMNTASPGVISAFQVNQYYLSHEAYVADLAEAMRHEYETIVAEGLTLQLDCPDLVMARHTASRISATRSSSPSRRRIRGPQRGHQQYPAGEDADARVLGQLRGAARSRHTAGADHRPDPQGAPRDDPLRVGEPAPRARVGRMA
ncbi:hypothetical protein BN11_4760012 [Nostocoides australiense Ben110]|uniref:Cobalamin-independent methionine synthase MetE C-terminal/archaeal domain-containing protein n=1 Tax=Nostocoides australiense Ben110 TaxID=1193182 RepID=W6JYW0_9MICO|nr:hypothetical protein [Tetrasphaera australiensis]CCH74748.1 hypothetical protein BN11_4760012 [Tetrasphaera australiensis Ben110]